MRHQTEDQAGWADAAAEAGLPDPRDCETLFLLRGFLTPIFEAAESWSSLTTALATKGYGLAFREGHLVILDEAGRGLCTGSALGVPLRSLAKRMGRPCVRASLDGHAGTLH
ncbi:hypothetical protein [Tropicibacter sp. S64]|uniref:hypothetical protein n=1 Tax=Tropicibacter sp. S64 TaxID=3415122 RepID=UPI003C7DE25E